MRFVRRGFTLIEILIVVTIISVLMLIIIPRIMLATTQAREDALKENLRHMRLAVMLFQSDTGGYPTALEQLVVLRQHAASLLPEKDATGMPISAEGYRGPYLNPARMPTDPFTRTGTWGYDPTTGEITSLSDLTAIDGSHYSQW